MIGGTAYAASKSGERRAYAAQQEADQEARLQALESQQAAAAAPPPPAAAPPPPPAAPPAPAAGGSDLTSKLMELKTLMDQGVLTPDEFNQAKQKLLGS
jgi:hypothetical protein